MWIIKIQFELGLDRREEKKTRQDKRREEKTTQDEMRLEKRRQDKERGEKTREEKRRQGKTRKEKTISDLSQRRNYKEDTGRKRGQNVHLSTRKRRAGRGKTPLHTHTVGVDQNPNHRPLKHQRTPKTINNTARKDDTRRGTKIYNGQCET